MFDPVSLKFPTFEKNSLFSPYYPIEPMPKPPHPLSKVAQGKVLLVLIDKPHTRALISEESLHKHFERL
jgi:hypothetical protein